MRKLTLSLLDLKLALRSMRCKEKIALLILFFVFFIGTLGIWTQLQEKFAQEVPVAGGTLREGIVGTTHLINPLLATTDADRDLSMLIYAGLLKSDGKGELEPELAEDYSISENGLIYTFALKENLVWHDGNTLDAEDIAFTINAAKNPAIKSPVRANWEGVEIEIVDNRTIRFLLKRPYAPFLENTTIGILPSHIWKEAAPEQFGLSEFNRQPIGAGPYLVKDYKRNSAGIITAYELKSFKNYALGKPLIAYVKINFYNSETDMIADYEAGRIDSLSSLSSGGADEIIKKTSLKLITLSLPRVFGIFFNQNKSEILRSKDVRQALEKATDEKAIIDDVLGGFGTTLSGPLPPGTIGHTERPSSFSIEEASNILEKDGWVLNEETGIREKKSKGEPARELTISIATANTEELAKTAEIIKDMWQKIGVRTDTRLYELGGLNQNIIRPREYEGLLFGQVVGRDPDPFAFWHSSQRNDPGLNIALYANNTVDNILETARTTNEIEERRKKYAEFEEEIVKDIPAIFLYSPHYLYAVPKNLKGLEAQTLTLPAERFVDIYKWHLYTTRVWKIFIP